MKKSILFGALAMFAIGALSIQNANAQTPVKVKKAETTTVSETADTPNATTVKQEPVKQKKDDCSDSKKVCADKKKSGDCCAEKKVSTDKKKSDDCCDEKKVVTSEKQVKADCKKECKHGDKKCDATKPVLKKSEKSETKETATDK